MFLIWTIARSVRRHFVWPVAIFYQSHQTQANKNAAVSEGSHPATGQFSVRDMPYPAQEFSLRAFLLETIASNRRAAVQNSSRRCGTLTKAQAPRPKSFFRWSKAHSEAPKYHRAKPTFWWSASEVSATANRRNERDLAIGRHARRRWHKLLVNRPAADLEQPGQLRAD